MFESFVNFYRGKNSYFEGLTKERIITILVGSCNHVINSGIGVNRVIDHSGCRVSLNSGYHEGFSTFKTNERLISMNLQFVIW